MRPRRIRHRHGWRAIKTWKAFRGACSITCLSWSRRAVSASLSCLAEEPAQHEQQTKERLPAGTVQPLRRFFYHPIQEKKARSIESQHAFSFSHLFLFFFVSVPVFFSLHSKISSPLISFVKAFSKHDVHASAVALRQHETTACFHNWMFSMCGAALLRCVELEVENRTQPLWECCVRLSVWTRFLPFYHPFS